MLLKVNDNTTIEDLQDKFNECYPHLKIEFFLGHHSLKENRPIEERVRISDISKNYHPGIIELKSWYRAEKVIAEMKHQLGLMAKLYRLQDHHLIPLGKEEQINVNFVSGKTKNSSPTEFQNDEELRLFI